MHVCSDERATVVGLDERIQSEQTELVAMRCIIAGFHAMKQLCCRNILGDNMILIDGGVFFFIEVGPRSLFRRCRWTQCVPTPHAPFKYLTSYYMGTIRRQHLIKVRDESYQSV